MSAEFNNSCASGNGCSYSKLGNYNGPSSSSLGVPTPRGTVSGTYVVPVYSAIGYNSLVHSSSTCGNHTTIDKAYGSSTCNQQYVKKLCN